MSEKTKGDNEPSAEPIICEVVLPIQQNIWGKPYEPHRGTVSRDIKQANSVKKLIFFSARYKNIKLPPRFKLISSEIIYEKNHIKTIKLAGFYLSEIDPVKVQARSSAWEANPPLETVLDENDDIVMSEKFSRQCYFVAHRSGGQLHLAWNLAENFDICQNPQNYSDIQWFKIDFTK